MDKGYQGAGIRVYTAIEGGHLGGNHTYSGLLTGTRAIRECANMLLDQRRVALYRLTLSYSKVGDIVAVALMLKTFEREAR